jgi:hypothetical protein
VWPGLGCRLTSERPWPKQSATRHKFCTQGDEYVAMSKVTSDEPPIVLPWPHRSDVVHLQCTSQKGARHGDEVGNC